jgi:hypothetical protein
MHPDSDAGSSQEGKIEKGDTIKTVAPLKSEL